MTAWDQQHLNEELERYERELTAAGFARSTLITYLDNARRFLRWRAGAYAPGDSPPRRSSTPQLVSPEGLATELIEYRADLHGAELAPLTVRTYLDHPSRFVRWLVDDYRPMESAGDGEVATAPASRREPRSREATPSGDWLAEAEVQAAIVTFLRGEGWSIDRQANTAKRERGIDVVASRGHERLAVEVKGFPGRSYVRGPRAGQPKPTHPSLQAGHYFAGAMLSAIMIRESDPTVRLAIGLPDVPRYRDLIGRSAESMGKLGITILLVRESGKVHWSDAKELARGA